MVLVIRPELQPYQNITIMLMTREHLPKNQKIHLLPQMDMANWVIYIIFVQQTVVKPEMVLVAKVVLLQLIRASLFVRRDGGCL